MFSSAVCLFCYSNYDDGGDEQHWDFPEFQLLGVNQSALLREANEYKYRSEEELGPVYGFVDLLQRIGHWEILRKFASILGVLIHVESINDGTIPEEYVVRKKTESIMFANTPAVRWRGAEKYPSAPEVHKGC